jgi:rare lipoprotein A
VLLVAHKMMSSKRLRALGSAVLAGVILSGCSLFTHAPPKPSAAAGPGPGHGIGVYKVGTPYEVNGLWYYPSPDLSYDETGIASWYGPGFQQQYTANGEVFDQNEVSGAHKTLPLPSVVQVTNLENGRSIQVRINDRGPYVGTRIVDLSHRAAQLLGYDQAGTAKVRVRVMMPETLEAQSLAKLNGSVGVPEIAEAAPPPAAAPREAVVAQALPPPGQAAPPPPPVHPAKPAPAQPPAPQPAPPGPVLSGTVTVLPVHPTRIFVQAGAFASNGNAERMRGKLVSVGPATITAVRINGANLYRVRLGPLATVDEADLMLNKVVAVGVSEAKIVVD